MVGNWRGENNKLRSGGAEHHPPCGISPRKRAISSPAFLTRDFGKFVATQGEAGQQSAEVRQHPLHMVLHPGHHVVVRHGRPAQEQGHEGTKRMGFGTKGPLTPTCL